MHRLLLLMAMISLPMNATQIQPGQVVATGDAASCPSNDLPIPGGLNLYDHAGRLVDHVSPSTGSSTVRHLISLGDQLVGVPDGGADETAIEVIDASGNRVPFAPTLSGLRAESIVGLARAGSDAIYAVIATAVGAEVWRVDRASGITLKRQLPLGAQILPGYSFAVDTDKSGCILYYFTNSSTGPVARFDACAGRSISDVPAGAGYTAAGMRVLPDGGLLSIYLDSHGEQLRHYDQNGDTIASTPLDTLLPYLFSPFAEYVPSIEALTLDTDPRFAWLFVSDGNPCGGSLLLLVDISTGAVLNAPSDIHNFNTSPSIAVSGGWYAAASPILPPHHRAVAHANVSGRE